MTLRSLLHEAKKVGGHKKAISPWRHHAAVATLRAAVKPTEQKAKLISGVARTARKMNSLEQSFRLSLDDLFSKVKSGKPLSNRDMKDIFRKHYQNAFQLGKIAAGGVRSDILPPLTNEDKKWLESFLRTEFNYWKKFVQDIQTGSGKMSYDMRKEMYVRTLKSAYNSARILDVPPTTVFYWVTKPGEHCSHCTYLAKNSPYTKDNLPMVPRSGETKCKAHCNCVLQSRPVSLTQYLRLTRGKRSREDILRGMKLNT